MYVAKEEEPPEPMQRVVLAALFVAAVVAIGALLSRYLARYFETSGDGTARKAGDSVQKVAFFLLLAVMAYAIMSGAN